MKKVKLIGKFSKNKRRASELYENLKSNPFKERVEDTRKGVYKRKNKHNSKNFTDDMDE
jgi:stalled ribosome alternative rescue factor ArfA